MSHLIVSNFSNNLVDFLKDQKPFSSPDRHLREKLMKKQQLFDSILLQVSLPGHGSALQRITG